MATGSCVAKDEARRGKLALALVDALIQSGGLMRHDEEKRQGQQR